MDLDRERERLRSVGNNSQLTQVGDGLRVRGSGGLHVDIEPHVLLALALEPRQPNNTELRQLQDDLCTDLYTKRFVQPGHSIEYLPEDSARAKRIYELLHPPPPKSLEQRTLDMLDVVLNDFPRPIRAIEELRDEWKARLNDTTTQT